MKWIQSDAKNVNPLHHSIATDFSNATIITILFTVTVVLRDSHDLPASLLSPLSEIYPPTITGSLCPIKILQSHRGVRRIAQVPFSYFILIFLSRWSAFNDGYCQTHIDLEHVPCK